MMTSRSVANLFAAPGQLFRKANFHKKNTKSFTTIFTRGHMVVQLVQALPYEPEGN
jgi:hypothetical protein